jgi:hypothetical protein
MELDNYGFLFNDIKIHGDILIKQSKNTEGADKIADEFSFYKKIIDENINFNIPQLIDYSPGILKIKYIANSTTLTNIINYDNINYYITKVFDNLNILHNNVFIVDYDTIYKDTIYEIETKIISRYNKTNWDQIPEFDTITHVNGLKIKNMYDYVTKIKNEIFSILSNHPTKYSLIHGDTHLGNILHEPPNNLYFIDPRGVYGHTKLYGLKHYDYAKFMFGLSGYSKFDIIHIHELRIKNSNLAIDFIKKYEDIFLNNSFDRLTQLFTLSIWLGNNSTFINTNKKVVSLMVAYYLCEKYL